MRIEPHLSSPSIRSDCRTSPRTEDAALQQAFLEIADEAWLVVDASKLGRRAMARIAPCEAFDRIFTDDRAPSASVAALAKLTEVETVESSTAEASAG